MIDKNNRNEVLKEVERICSSYAKHQEVLKKASDEIKRLEALKETEPFRNCTELVDDSIRIQDDIIMQCLKEMCFFECAVLKLGGRTALVMQQLYAEGISWDFVKNEKGKILSRDTIARERKKAISFMADLYPTDRYIHWGEE